MFVEGKKKGDAYRESFDLHSSGEGKRKEGGKESVYARREKKKITSLEEGITL